MSVVLIMGESPTFALIAPEAASLCILEESWLDFLCHPNSISSHHASWPGFGATHQCWEPQLDRLLQMDQPSPTRCLLMDNRGVGRSGSPSRKSAYHTAVMAADVFALMVSPGNS